MHLGVKGLKQSLQTEATLLLASSITKQCAQSCFSSPWSSWKRPSLSDLVPTLWEISFRSQLRPNDGHKGIASHFQAPRTLHIKTVQLVDKVCSVV